MLGELMGFEIHLRLKYDKFLLKTFPVIADEVVLLEMFLQRIIVHVVMWLSRVSPIAKEASLMLVAAMFVQLVAIVESGAAETAERMAPETRLICRTWLVISMAHVLRELLIRKHVMLVCKDFLVPSAEVAHLLVVGGTDMAMEVWPSETGEVAFGIWTIVSKQKNGVAHYVFTGVSNSDVVVGTGDFGGSVLFVTFRSIVGKDDKLRSSLVKLATISLRFVSAHKSHKNHIHDNEGNPCSCRVLSAEERKDGM